MKPHHEVQTENAIISGEHALMRLAEEFDRRCYRETATISRRERAGLMSIPQARSATTNM